MLSRAPRLALIAVIAALSLEGVYRGFLWTAARLARDTPPHAFEIYAVGESTAAGVPYPPRTAPAYLVKKILGGTVDHRTIVVTVTARAGESIFPQAARFERAIRARRRDDPGVVLIYAGHNDAAYEESTPAFELLRERILYRSALLRDLFFLVEEHVPAWRVRTLGTYEYHLRRVVELARASGLTPILTTTVSNTADMDPWLSADGEAVLGPGEALEKRGEWAKALSLYRAAAVKRPELADYLRFKTARCLARLGRWDDAAPMFHASVEARIPDNFGRATSAQNEVVRRLSGEYGVPLVDAEALFATASPHGVPGDDLFIDGQHPDFRGYVLLAGEYARAVSAATGARVFEPMAWSPALLDALGVTKTEQALALVEAGRWYFSVASRHSHLGPRLDAAAARFRTALALDPTSFSARLGLELTAAARRPGFLDRNSDWLGTHRLFYGGAYDFRAEIRPDLLVRLRAEGAPEARLAALLAATGP
jgi:lysophospholipase L1-like esterase